MIWLVVWNPNCYSLHHFYLFFQRGRYTIPPTSDDFSIFFRILWIFFGPTLWFPPRKLHLARLVRLDQVSSPRAVEKTVRAQAIFPVGWPLFWDPKSGRTCCCPTCSKVRSCKLYIYINISLIFVPS